MSGISRDEWLAAVAAVSEPTDTHPEAITMMDFCELLHLKSSAAKVRMRTLVKAQKARRVLKTVDRDGRRLVVPAYVLIKEIPDDRRAPARVERRAGRDRHAAPRRS